MYMFINKVVCLHMIYICTQHDVLLPSPFFLLFSSQVGKSAPGINSSPLDSSDLLFDSSESEQESLSMKWGGKERGKKKNDKRFVL